MGALQDRCGGKKGSMWGQKTIAGAILFCPHIDPILPHFQKIVAQKVKLVEMRGSDGRSPFTPYFLPDTKNGAKKNCGAI